MRTHFTPSPCSKRDISGLDVPLATIIPCFLSFAPTEQSSFAFAHLALLQATKVLPNYNCFPAAAIVANSLNCAGANATS